MKGGPLHVAALTRAGAATAALAARALGAQLHLPARLAGEFPGALAFEPPMAGFLAGRWEGAGGFVLVMAAGIVVRSIAPLLATKYEDPAVVLLDPEGRFAVPLLSGHLGGANELAATLAGALGGQAVLTTATDAAGAVAVEVWAAERGLTPLNPGSVARINRALAEGEVVALHADPRLKAPEPPPGFRSVADARAFEAMPEPKVAVALAAVPGALTLVPRAVVLGVGAKRNASPERLALGVAENLDRLAISPEAVAAVATIDLKRNEPAVTELAAKLGVPLLTFDAETLAAIEVPNPSARVRLATGSPAVAEAAALAGSGAKTLILEKTAGPDWTLAAALKKELSR